MSWWKRQKCKLCKTVIKKGMKVSEVRVDTAEGVLELEVCPKCAFIIDKSADILLDKPRSVSKDSEDDFTV